MAVALRPRPRAGEQVREVRREPVVDEVHVRLRRDRAQVAQVGLRAGHDEARGAQLAAQPAVRVQIGRVDVARVAGERERQPGDRRGVPGDRRRAVRDVRVQVADVGRVEQPVGERDRLQQFLEVDLARTGEGAAAVAQGLGERRARGARQPKRTAAQTAPQTGQERPQVRRAPRMERRGERRRVREVGRTRTDRVQHGVVVPLLPRLHGLDDEQAQRHAGRFHAVDLGGDERLGDAREAHQDVGDGPVHNPVTGPLTPTSRS